MRGIPPAAHPDIDDPGTPSRVERLAVWALLATTLALRLACVFRYRINSDESQHLHVVWAWTTGQLPYRDVFDNHMPLFQLACAPLLWLVGERPDAIVVMRIAMLPFFLGTLWCLGRIARRLFTVRDALWTIVLGGLMAAVFFSSLEFRTDDAWMMCWFFALATAIEGEPSLRRSAATGFVFGLATAISLKTTMLLAAFGFAACGVAVIAHGELRPASERATANTALWGRHMAAFLTGFVAMPLTVTLGFAIAGALRPFLYDAIEHNLVPGLDGQHRLPWMAACAAALLALWSIAWWGYHRSRGGPVNRRRVLVFLAAGAYVTVSMTLWPLHTRQDDLPALPLLMLAAVPALRSASDFLAARVARVPRWAGLSLATVAAWMLLLDAARPWHDGTTARTALVADTLRLTDRSDPVLDLKGDTVFRLRPSYYALESVTKARLRLGLVHDDIPKSLVTTATHVALANLKGFPPRTRAFLRANFVPVGRLRVAGQWLRAPVPGEVVTFEVAVPGIYTIVGANGPVGDILLDDQSFLGPRSLAPGPHELVLPHAKGPVAIVWARAVERGFVPHVPVRWSSSGIG